VRAREGLAVERGVDGDGADLVDDVKVPDVQVDPRLLAELARGPHDG